MDEGVKMRMHAAAQAANRAMLLAELAKPEHRSWWGPQVRIKAPQHTTAREQEG